jgi:hypothetical protein
MAYALSFLSHVNSISTCLPLFGGRAEIDFETAHVEIRARGRRVQLQPQFVVVKNGSMAFTPKLVSDAVSFCGWRAYFNRVWPAAVEKLTFKEFCTANRLRAPSYWINPQDVSKPAVLKRSRSSFSQGISSPSMPETIRASNPVLTHGEYFDEFIPGTIAKIWYWNEAPVCLEMASMPSVVGDGANTLRLLISRSKVAYVKLDWARVEAIAAFQGLSLDSIVPSGRQVLVDFRYISPLHAAHIVNQNVFPRYVDTPLVAQLRQDGRVFWRAIPEAVRQNTLYTVDAIVDSSQRAWYLEMNCNPIVHPDTYFAMFESFFGEADMSRATVPPLHTYSNLASSTATTRELLH